MKLFQNVAAEKLLAIGFVAVLLQWVVAAVIIWMILSAATERPCQTADLGVHSHAS